MNSITCPTCSRETFALEIGGFCNNCGSALPKSKVMPANFQQSWGTMIAEHDSSPVEFHATAARDGAGQFCPLCGVTLQKTAKAL